MLISLAETPWAVPASTARTPYGDSILYRLADRVEYGTRDFGERLLKFPLFAVIILNLQLLRVKSCLGTLVRGIAFCFGIGLMCARYKLTTPTGVIVEDFRIRVGRPNLAARYNIAPTQKAPIIRKVREGRELAMLKWGLIPAWSKDAKLTFTTINARAETVAEKPAFRDALAQRRCLVVADGYYEWKSEEGGKQPYLMARADEKLMAFAGLWELWAGESEPIESFTIIVSESNALVRDIHDRMPVILEPTDFDAWLDVENNAPHTVQPLLKPYPAEQMKTKAVNRALNNVHAEGAHLIDAPSQYVLRL
jgi:putative SOS response-associated peptidase YedK